MSLKTIQEIKQMANNKEMRPSAEDMYVYRIGNTLYRHSGDNISGYETDEGEGAGVYYMAYIQNIDDSDWSDDTDLSNKFSNKILHKGISIAAATLLDEDSR